MNEILFIGFFITLAALTLGAFRLGKEYLLAFVAVCSVLMNIFVTKQFMLFGLEVTGGNALYGVIFLATDLLSEHYGKAEAYKAVKAGIFSSILFVIATQVLIHFAPNDFDFAHESITTLFSLTPRILLGSVLAFLISQSLDVHLFHKIKQKTAGKLLWARNLGSTLTSQAVDTLIFTAVGLTTFGFLPIEGVIPSAIFWQVAGATYAVKIIVALIDTPFLYLSKKIAPTKNFSTK